MQTSASEAIYEADKQLTYYLYEAKKKACYLIKKITLSWFKRNRYL